MPIDLAKCPVLHVVITREMFSDWWTLTLDNGHSEELEIEDVREWFTQRGADMDKVQKALDHAWNFMRAEVNINRPKEPPLPKLPYTPQL